MANFLNFNFDNATSGADAGPDNADTGTLSGTNAE
jgi:hypothetical protein